MNEATSTPEPIADSGSARDAETFEEKCARLGVEIDDSSGSEVIFASRQFADRLREQSNGTVKSWPSEASEDDKPLLR